MLTPAAWSRVRSLLRPRRARAARHPRRLPLRLEVLETRTLPAGTWTALANLVPDSVGTGTMLLRTDGTVMVQGGGVSNAWYQLTPNAQGSYASGAWSVLASMNVQRLFFASDVLPSGKVFITGGEYSGPDAAQDETNSGEIYDPVANTWTNLPNFPLSQAGDAISTLLPNGNVLVGSLNGADTFAYNPASNAWSEAGTKLREDPSSEEGWVKLGDGSILSYDVGSSYNTGNPTAQRYIPSTNTWVDAGTVPVQLTSYYELGPGLLLPDGRALFFGDNGNSAYYTPSSNTWAAGPVIPSGLAASDVPAAVLPNGDVLLAAGTSPHNGGVNSPTTIFELNPTTNVYTNVTPSSSVLGTSGSATNARMVVLPSGQVLVTTGGTQLAVYTPSGSPHNAWKPTVSSIVSAGGLTYTLTGTQLNGLSEGAAFGDDAQMATNYPIVQLTSGGGTISFAATTNWVSQVSTGNTAVTTQFTLPAGLPVGSYSLEVIANGIASTPVSFTNALSVVSSSPAAGGTVSAAPTSFVVNFNEAVVPGSVSAGEFQVNGVKATGVTLNGSDTVATFTYSTSPVTTQGVQNLALAANQVQGADGSKNTAYNASFRYDSVTLAVTGTNPPVNGVVSLAAGASLTLDVTFDEPIDPATASTANLVLNQGTVTAAVVQSGNTTVAYTIAGLADGPLTVSLAAGQVLDAFDNPAFTPFSGSYTVDFPTQPLPALRPVLPAGSLTYQSTAYDQLTFAGDTDQFIVSADPGQTLTVLVLATSPGLQPGVQLSDPSSHVLGSGTAAAAGQNVLLQTLATTTGGTYTVTVTGAGSSTGSYTLEVFLDTAVEASAYGLGSDSTLATAQSLDSAFGTLQTSLAAAAQASVVGSAGYTPLVLNAVFSGWWDNTGYHNPTNPNYIAGQYYNPPLEKFHDFFVFDLGAVPYTIASAQLDLSNPSDGYYSTNPSDTYTSFDVSTPISALEAAGSGTGNPNEVAIFKDLGSGTQYGNVTVSAASDGQTVAIGLDSAALTALNNARGTQFAFGGNLTTATGNNDQAIFADTGNNSQTKQLLLSFATDTHYYSLTLAAGQEITVGLKNLTGYGNTLALEDANGNTLATGVSGAANLDEQVSGFVAPSAGTYYLVVSGTPTNVTYDLVVSRGAAFGTQPHNTFATAQDVTGTQGAVGAVTWSAGNVVPAADAGAETNSGNAYPFSYVTTMRYQQIYAAAELGGGGVIDSIQFRRSSGQGPFTSTTMNVLIRLGYAATTVTTASQTFAANVGSGGLVTVYSGPLVLASTSPNGTPQAFDVLINLTHDFSYNPSQGALLLDLSVYGGSGSPFYLEATSSEDTASTTRIFSFDVNEPVGFVGSYIGQTSPYGLVTRFAYAAAPTPDWYKVTLASNQTAMRVETATPLGGPNQAVNGLYPTIQLFNASDVLVASGTLLSDGRNEYIQVTGLTPGATYYVEVSSANASAGEYFLGVTPLETPTITVTVDDSGTGFTTNGTGWKVVHGVGYNGGEHKHAGVAGGTGFAQWKYTETVTAGTHYDIFVTWVAAAGNATNATYTVYDGTKLLATVTLDQTRSPNTGLVGSTLVQLLYIYTPTRTGSHTIKIKLSDNANGTVVADAIFDPPVASLDPPRPAPGVVPEQAFVALPRGVALDATAMWPSAAPYVPAAPDTNGVARPSALPAKPPFDDLATWTLLYPALPDAGHSGPAAEKAVWDGELGENPLRTWNP